MKLFEILLLYAFFGITIAIAAIENIRKTNISEIETFIKKHHTAEIAFYILAFIVCWFPLFAAAEIRWLWKKWKSRTSS
jgi:4-hydroxybenzoate polyprenyltransferase